MAEALVNTTAWVGTIGMMGSSVWNALTGEHEGPALAKIAGIGVIMVVVVFAVTAIGA